MKLFERLNIIAERIAGSQTRLAKAIGIPQGTFNGYLSDEGQRKIRLDLLEGILLAYPQVSRNWLYFGEGEMIGEQITAISEKKSPGMQELQAKNTELEEELREANRLNRRLTERLLDEATNKVK